MSSLYFPGDPLVEGESVTARQEFTRCELSSPDSDPVVVEAAEPVPAPVIIPPLCDGSTFVRVTGLLRGSKVRILQNGVELGIGEAADSTFDFLVSPLTGGSIITAQQELCNIWSDLSNEITVDPKPASLPTPSIAGPLYECGSVVRVTNIQPGVTVYVYSRMFNAPIGWQQVYSTEADIPVTPQLVLDDEIYARQVGCGLKSSKSPSLTVQKLPQVTSPAVQPLDDCMRSVPVTNVIPGASVHVYVDGIWRCTSAAGTSSIEVPISGVLQAGNSVRARQRICWYVTELGSPTIVALNTTGYWRGPYNIPAFAVHTALVYNRTTRKAKVLMFSGGAEQQLPRESWLWNPETNELTSQTFHPDDLFCAHHSFLADGRLLVIGGAIYEAPHGRGIKATYTFDPVAEGWIKVKDMNYARWYPTAVSLPDGKVLALSGHDEHHNIVSQVEIYDPDRDIWTSLPPTANKALEIYPIPSGQHAGKIFYSGTRWAGGSSASTWAAPPTALFNLSINTWQDVGGHIYSTRTEGMSVLLPISDNARVLVLGGGHNASDSHAETAEIIDLNIISPTWANTPDMNFRRTNVNAVILPDGKVFVSGGHRDFKWDADLSDHIFEAEIFHPDIGSGSWTIAARMNKPRQYHSESLLLPDGRVLCAGGVVPSPSENQRNLEIYYPPYLCRGRRPEISSAPEDISYGNTFTVTAPQANAISKVVLIRPMAVTHHTDTEQRYIALKFRLGGPEKLQVLSPGDGNVAPPGYYMLFILDSNGIPSIAKFVRLSHTIMRQMLKNIAKLSPDILMVEKHPGISSTPTSNFFLPGH